MINAISLELLGELHIVAGVDTFLFTLTLRIRFIYRLSYISALAVV